MPRVPACKGIVTSEDMREVPLARCKAPRDEGSEYCAHHRSQGFRQDKLRGVLKVGWESALRAAPGRPKLHEPEVPTVEDVQSAMQSRPVPVEPEAQQELVATVTSAEQRASRKRDLLKRT
jgi:hypothetical protein